MLTFRTPYDGVFVEESVYLDDEPSLTKQSFQDECDINNIMAKYVKTGLIDHVNQFQGQYADLTGCMDYHAALNQVLAAEDAFMTLPAQIRAQFQNDPGEFLAFVDNPENEEKMIQMGLKQRSFQPTGISEKSKNHSISKEVPGAPQSPGVTGTVEAT